MKILFIVNQIGGGGAERVISIIANKMCCDEEITILYLTNTKIKYDFDKRITLKKINSSKSKIKTIADIGKEINNISPDCIISFEYHINIKVIIACMIVGFRKKLIVSERNDPVTKGGSFPIKQIRDILYKKVDYLVCQTPDVFAYFKDIKNNKKRIIENPVSSGISMRSEIVLEDKIVNFCRLEKQKNLELLIDSFFEFSKEHPTFQLEIYGDGSQREELLNRIDAISMQDRVKIYPFVNDIHNRIKNYKMFVSSSNFEGLSNSMLEAMAIGIPTICTDCPCGGARMVIEDGINGILVPVGDKNALVRAMAIVAGNSDFANNLSKEGIKVSEKYSTDSIANKWIEIIY